MYMTFARASTKPRLFRIAYGFFEKGAVEMASKEVALSSTAVQSWDMCLSPLDKVRSFFEALEDLRQATDGAPAGNTRCDCPCGAVAIESVPITYVYTHTHMHTLVYACKLEIMASNLFNCLSTYHLLYMCATVISACGCRMLQACEKVSLCGEQVVLCLEQQIWQHNRAAETAQEVSGLGNYLSRGTPL